jgi:hypothetical protein
MKRLLIVSILLFAFTSITLPAVAQTATVDPAAYIPARATIYIELRTDESGIAVLDGLTDLTTAISGMTQGSLIDDLVMRHVTELLPGVDFQADILPWLGERMALSAATTMGTNPQPDDFVFVLPIGDAAGAQAFVERVAGAAPQDAGGVQVYTIGDAKLGVGTAVMWLGTGTTIDSLFSFALENLSQDPSYQQVRGALPTDAAITAYISGSLIADAVQQSSSESSMPDAAVFWQAALRLHPAQSAAEDALLALPSLNGVGFAVQITETQVDLTAALSVNAQYPAPTLTTASAGSALLDLLPADSMFAFSSYDVPVVSLLFGGLFAPLASIDTQEILDNIVSGLEGTPAPTPTPTPVPELVTVDTILAELEPVVRQAESTMGLSRNELYALINGEYALAAFPNGANVGVALYLQSADPQRLIDTLDHVSHLLLTNPDPVEQLFTLEQTTISSTEVILVSSPNLSERLALGILNGNVLFITPESSAQHVTEAASDTTPSPATPLRDQFGSGQEAFFFADLPALQAAFSALVGEGESTPPPLSSVSGALDMRENGLFVLRISGTA